MDNRRHTPKKVLQNFDGDNTPDDFNFPDVGIEDMDRAIFNLFDKRLSFEVTSQGVLQKVPVIFSSGERFALTRRKTPIRDKNDALILPLISIKREGFDIGPGQKNKKTAISFRPQPRYTIKYRLSESDRDYQNIVNKLGLKNQDNVASSNNFLETSPSLYSTPGKIATRRNANGVKFSKNVDVNLSNQHLNKNIFEIIEIPYPYFIATTYNVTFWTQYMKQSNQMIETFLNSLDVPGRAEFAITSEKGYEYVAFLSSEIGFDNNFDNFTEEERTIKHSFTLTLPGYIINSKQPGLPKLTRSYYSAPNIEFSYFDSESAAVINYQPERHKEKVKRHVLSDINAVDENENTRGESSESFEEFIPNPFSEGEKQELARVRSKNARTGETVVSSKIVKEIEVQFE